MMSGILKIEIGKERGALPKYFNKPLLEIPAG